MATPKIEKTEDNLLDESSVDAPSINLDPPVTKRTASPADDDDDVVGDEQPDAKDHAAPPKIVSTHADHQSAMLRQFRMGYRECMSETMHFLVESEGFFAADSFCVRLMAHLQKYCEAFTSENTPPSGTFPNFT
jgi:hypothetical protein